MSVWETVGIRGRGMRVRVGHDNVCVDVRRLGLFSHFHVIYRLSCRWRWSAFWRIDGDGVCDAIRMEDAGI